MFVVPRERLMGSATVRLDGAEGRHAATVTRLREGEQVVLTDGAGRIAECTVAVVERDHLDLTIERRTEVPAPQPRLVVVQALPKGERGELAVETMTEVGVDLVVPWAAYRCITRWKAGRKDKALSRWRNAAFAAGKQARRAHFPEVAELASTSDVAGLLAAAATGLVLHEDATSSLAAVTPPASGDVVLVVGPEGGLTPDELAAFEAAGASAYRLGPTVLRTSTAGAAALAVLLARTDRWR